jgi:hypothetical protein
MNFDFAILYFGLPRTIEKVYHSHVERIYDVLDRNQFTYKKFMHTWHMDENESITNSDFSDFPEYKIVNPDFYKKDCEIEFLKTINMDDYFYRDVWNAKRECYSGEWLPHLVSNHLCALESQRRCIQMMQDFINEGNYFKFVIILRQDIFIKNDLPIESIIYKPDEVSIPDFDHFEGYNDRLAVMNYENSLIYGNRMRDLKYYRKTHGRIVAEKCLKYSLGKYNRKINMIPFYFDIIRN